MPQAQASLSVKPHMGKWKPILGALLIIVVLAGILMWFQSSRLTGSVTVLVRGLDDTRTLHTLSLQTRELTENATADPNSFTTVSTRTFVLQDGSVIKLDTAGVVRLVNNQLSSVLIASPTAPLLRTPLSVWNDGARVAWLSPADRSIQVFERSARGAYVPIYLNAELPVSSLGFSDDGKTLVVGTMREDVTDFYAIPLSSGRVQKVTTAPGLASVVPTP